MCGRYALHANPDVVALQFKLSEAPAFRPSYNIAPTADALVIRDQKGSLARWGLRGRFVNLRAETVLAKFAAVPRCLVPASGFYEWQAAGRRKQPFYFTPRREPLLALAALWERHAFTLITTQPNAALDGVHDRMPLLVAPRDYAAWLAGDEAILEKPVSLELARRPVGMAVNAAANDSPQLIEPVELSRGLFDEMRD